MIPEGLTFAYPLAALLLPVPLIVAALRRGGGDGTDSPHLTYAHVQRLRQAFGQRPRRAGRWLAVMLLLLAWVAFVGALMRPQTLERVDQQTTQGYDLMLAVDVSQSMAALDFSSAGERVNRLAVVKGVVGRFAQARTADRLGLVLFGARAYVQSPLTTDGQAIARLLDAAVPAMLGPDTAIGDAIGQGVKVLKDRPEGSRVLILLTDGANTGGRLAPETAIGLAREFGVRIYTVGVGSNGTVLFPDPDEGLVMRRLPIDESLLREAAQATGGRYFRATNPEALQAIYEAIDRLEPSEITRRTIVLPTEYYRWPLGLGVLLMGLALVAGPLGGVLATLAKRAFGSARRRPRATTS